MSNNVLITGGAGFLGYHLGQGLADRDVGKLFFSDAAPFEADEYPDGSVFLEADVRDREAMRHVILDHDIDTVIHTAAALPLWKKEDIFTTNVAGLRTTLELALEKGVQRFVFISSTAVYGVPDKHPLVEDDPMVGVGHYGNSKIQGERVCEEFRGKGMSIAIVRPKTFIGTARLGVFQILYDWVDSGKRIPIIGNGSNRYQLLEVSDLVEAIWLAASQPHEVANDTFNVGAQEFGTVRHDVGALCEYAGNGARVQATPSVVVKPTLALFESLGLSPLYKWVYGTADKDSFVSTEKIETQLGWSAKHSNAEALIMSHQWYLDHKHELQGASSGVTHRVGWDQGILGLFKRFM